jgi:aminoglycoside phosphotransferase (APT) family kinase protein
LAQESLPWILDLGSSNKQWDGNYAAKQLIAYLQADENVLNELLHVKNDWNSTHFIHGDVRWGNLLVDYKANRLALCLIDWEFSGLGDPCWDMACLLESYVAASKWGFQNKQVHAFKLENMHASIQALINTYAQMRGIVNGSKLPWLIKILRFTAVRILQQAVENASAMPIVQVRNMQNIQFAMEMLSDPNAMIHTITGLTVTSK